MKTSIIKATPPLNRTLNSILINQSTQHINDADLYYSIQFNQRCVFCEPVNGNPFIFHKSNKDGELGTLEINEPAINDGTDKIRARALLQLEFDRQSHKLPH